MGNDVEKRVIKTIADVLERKADEIRIDASLQDDLNLDSLKQMTLSILLEDEFDLTIPPEDLTGIVTVKDIVDFIHRKLQETAQT